MKTETLNVVRLSEDDVGESHFDEYPVSQILTPFAPPAFPFFVSPIEESSGYVTIRIPVGWVGERHPSPYRQILFCLAGSLKVTASDGTARTIEAGMAWLMTDTNGNGHRSEVVSPVPFDAAIVVLPKSG